MGNQPLVSIITINYRQAAVTSELLDSIRINSFKNVEVIVVDNGYLENKTALFKHHYPDVKVILSKENRGFAGGNNLGLRKAKGDYLFLVNNDTELTDGLIENLLSRFKTKGVGAVSPKIRYHHHPEIIQYAGFTEVNPLTARNKTIGQHEKDQGQHDQAQEVPYVHGAAMMLSRSAFEKAGVMPELYFLYYEELDWSVRIREAGFRLFYEPKALIYHKESMAVGKLSTLKTYYLTRNRILFMRRNAPVHHLLLFTLFWLCCTMPKWIALFLFRREFKHLRAFIRGIFWHLPSGKQKAAALKVREAV